MNQHGAARCRRKSALYFAPERHCIADVRHVLVCDDRVVSVVVGGVYVDRAATRTANEVCAELRAVNGIPDLADYHVDLCFLTYVEGGLGSDGVAGTGIRPGMVGRKQRRFIVYLEVPPSLPNRLAYGKWLASALGQAATIVRDYLPRKGKGYPAERLAAEIDDLRRRWVGHLGVTT